EGAPELRVVVRHAVGVARASCAEIGARVVPDDGDLPRRRVERDPREELAVRRRVVVDAHRRAPGRAAVVGVPNLDVGVVLFVPGTTSSVENSPTCPRPVTRAPNAPSGPPTLTTTHTSPPAAVIVGWSTKWKRPRFSLPVSFRLAIPLMFAISRNESPPSVE